jgi:DNA (cytosine-5)-methyltransferase 1
MRCADIFAGWGGFSLGAELAGCEVLWAANHWKLAVDVHKLNIPGAEHLCQDLQQANFYDIPDIDLLLAAPACQGHSTASQPRRRRYHDYLRSTALSVVSCADAKEPEVIVVENVPSFRRWRLYRGWMTLLQDLGYSVEEHLLTASHHGVPQRRRRLFIIATKSKNPIGLQFSKTPEPPIGPVLDIDIEVEWTPISEGSEGVQKRIAKGRRNHGDLFLTQHVTNHPGVPLNEPIRTVTCQDHWALVKGQYYRPLTIKENARAMGFPDSYKFPLVATRVSHITGLGNAVCPPVARDIITKIKEAV